jgi:hypothetical protein
MVENNKMNTIAKHCRRLEERLQGLHKEFKIQWLINKACNMNNGWNKMLLPYFLFFFEKIVKKTTKTQK